MFFGKLFKRIKTGKVNELENTFTADPVNTDTVALRYEPINIYTDASKTRLNSCVIEAVNNIIPFDGTTKAKAAITATGEEKVIERILCADIDTLILFFKFMLYSVRVNDRSIEEHRIIIVTQRTIMIRITELRKRLDSTDKSDASEIAVSPSLRKVISRLREEDICVSVSNSPQNIYDCFLYQIRHVGTNEGCTMISHSFYIDIRDASLYVHHTENLMYELVCEEKVNEFYKISFDDLGAGKRFPSVNIGTEEMWKNFISCIKAPVKYSDTVKEAIPNTTQMTPEKKKDKSAVSPKIPRPAPKTLSDTFICRRCKKEIRRKDMLRSQMMTDLCDDCNNYRGICGENAFWEFSADNVLHIYGKGTLTDFMNDADHIRMTEYDPHNLGLGYIMPSFSELKIYSSVRDIIIYEGIEAVRDQLVWFPSVKKIVFPSSVTDLDKCVLSASATDVMIYGVECSAAQAFAEKNGYGFRVSDRTYTVYEHDREVAD